MGKHIRQYFIRLRGYYELIRATDNDSAFYLSFTKLEKKKKKKEKRREKELYSRSIASN